MMRRVDADISVDASSADAIDAFLNPAALRAWWGVERSLVEACEGGLYALTWNVSDAGFGYVSTGIIGTIAPSSLLVIDKYTYFNPERRILGPMRLTVRADAVGPGRSHLHVCQDGYRDGEDWDWYHEAVTGAWPVVLESVKAYLEKDQQLRSS